MNPIFLLLINLFGVFLIINESILIERANKLKVVIIFITLTVSFGAVTTYDFIMANDTYAMMYNVFVLLNLIAFAIELFLTYRISSLKGSYFHIFIKSLKEIKSNVHMIVDEKERIMEISDTLLEDIGLRKAQVIGRRYMDIVNYSLEFTKMNDQSIDNNYIEQYYLRYTATSKSQKTVAIEYEYINHKKTKEVLHVIEKPIFINNKYKGRILVGDKVTSTEMVKSRRDYENLKSELVDLQHRFQVTLGLLDEGLFYLTESSNDVWGTDKYKEILKLDSNIVKHEDIVLNINPNDKKTYEQHMKIKNSKGSYKVSYRYKFGELDKWLIEEGKTIETSDGPITVGLIKEVDTRSGIKKISFLDEIDYKVNVKRLISEKKPFWIMRINFDKVSDYNVNYGREITAHTLNEFLKKLKRNYDNEDSKMYELSKTEYVIILSNPMDFSIVKKSLLSGSELFIMKALMGGIEVVIKPSIGIVEYPKDTMTFEDIIKSAEKTVGIAGKDFNKHYFCFYEEIKDVF